MSLQVLHDFIGAHADVEGHLSHEKWHALEVRAQQFLGLGAAPGKASLPKTSSRESALDLGKLWSQKLGCVGVGPSPNNKKNLSQQGVATGFSWVSLSSEISICQFVLGRNLRSQCNFRFEKMGDPLAGLVRYHCGSEPAHPLGSDVSGTSVSRCVGYLLARLALEKR